MYMYIYMYIYVYMYVCIYIYVHTDALYVYVYVCVCVRERDREVCTYILICIYVYGLHDSLLLRFLMHQHRGLQDCIVLVKLWLHRRALPGCLVQKYKYWRNCRYKSTNTDASRLLVQARGMGGSQQQPGCRYLHSSSRSLTLYLKVVYEALSYYCMRP